MNPKPETTVVIGVGPGLGESIARRFARGGHAVALVARGEDKLTALAADIEKQGGKALAVAADATDAGSLAAALARVGETLGPAGVLVYNAGVFRMAGLLELEPADFDHAFKANCAGAFYAARCVLPAMLAAGRGTVLFTGATGSIRGGARFSALAVGKFGLRALAQSMAREFGPQGIHVAHVVIDGMIDTPRVRELMPGREAHTLLSPEAIAEQYWQLHTQDPTAWTFELDLRPAVEKF